MHLAFAARLVTMLALPALFVACDSPAGPAEPIVPNTRIVVTPLAGLSDGLVSVRDGYVGIRANVPAGEPVLKSYERVEVTVTSSNGDTELIVLAPSEPHPSGVGFRIRREYVVTVTDSSVLATLVQSTVSDAVRYRRFGTGVINFASMFVFGSDETAIAESVARVPGVQFVSPNALAWIGTMPTESNLAHGALAVTIEPSVTRGNGTLTIARGDTLTYVYRGVGGMAQYRTVVE